MLIISKEELSGGRNKGWRLQNGLHMVDSKDPRGIELAPSKDCDLQFFNKDGFHELVDPIASL